MEIQPLLGLSALGSGAALLIALALHAPLGLLLCLALAFFVAALLYKRQKLPPRDRRVLKRQL